MGNNCEGGSCETKSVSACSEESSGCEEQSCSCGSNCGGNPMKCAQAMWCSAFPQAMKEVAVDILKEKIRKSWGSKMEKAADIILEAMGAKWQAAMAAARNKEQIQEKLHALWNESGR